MMMSDRITPNDSTDTQPSGRPGVIVTEIGDVTELQLSYTQTICYRITHPIRHVFDAEESSLARLVESSPALLAVDRNVHAHYGKAIQRYVDSNLLAAGLVLIDATEKYKCWEQVEKLCAAAVHASLPRHGILVAVGGGVTLDLTGMAAAVFRRGIGYIRIPT